MLGLFVNPLTVDDKYCLLKRGDLLQHFQIELSQKRKTCSEFRFNFEYFRKKDDPPSSYIFEFMECQKVAR